MKVSTWVIAAMGGLFMGAVYAGGQTAAPLGSPEFKVSPEQPIGWRGDGTGRYPGATPPTVWERKRSGSGYETQGILWMTPLPSEGVSCPIVVGSRVFLTTEHWDVVCLDKQTGRILWIRSNPEFEGMSAEDRKGDAAYAEKLAPLADELMKANAAAAEELNGEQAKAMGSAKAAPGLALTKKRAIEKQIWEGQLKVYGKDEYHQYGAQGVFGYAGPTAASDGKCVYAFFATGVSACYDLEGHRKWIALGKGGGAEHGNFASPILCSNQFIVWGGFTTRSYDAATGKELWTNGDQGGNTYGSMFRIQVGSDMVAAFQSGFFTRVRDGKAIWNKRAFSEETSTPIVEGGTIYAFARTGQRSELKAFRIPASTDSGMLKPEMVLKSDWADDLPDKDFKRGTTASPLYVDGLVYCLTEGGGLMVNDGITGEVAYRKVLPMKPRTEYWNWAGASASPTLAGKHIYLMDNQGTTIVIEPGREYKQVASNLIEEVEKADWKAPGGKTQEQMVSTPVFEGTRMYYRTPGYLYCIGEK